jgi:hypothetical protein
MGPVNNLRDMIPAVRRYVYYFRPQLMLLPLYEHGDHCPAIRIAILSLLPLQSSEDRIKSGSGWSGMITTGPIDRYTQELGEMILTFIGQLFTT